MDLNTSVWEINVTCMFCHFLLEITAQTIIWKPLVIPLIWSLGFLVRQLHVYFVFCIMWYEVKPKTNTFEFSHFCNKDESMRRWHLSIFLQYKFCVSVFVISYDHFDHCREATAFCAAVSMSWAVWIGRPLSSRILDAASTL